MRILPSLVACVVFVFAPDARAASNVVFNGTFDTPVPTNASGGGWTSAGLLPGWGWVAAGGHPGSHFVLNSNGLAGSDPSLSQTISGLAPGEEYVVSGDYACFANNTIPANGISFDVAVDGTAIFTALATPGTLSTGGSWLGFSARFTAPAAGSVILRLRSELDPTDNDIAVDNVSVTPACGILNGTFSVAVPADGGSGWVPASNGLGGWSATGGNPDGYYWLNNVGGGSPDPCVAGNVTLNPGQRYRLTGDYASIAREQSPAGTASLAVLVNGALLIGPSLDPLMPTVLREWNSFEYEFVAQSTANTLSFHAEFNGSDNDFGIDNICLVPLCDCSDLLVNGTFAASVPENATGGGWTSANIQSGWGWQSSGGIPGGYFILNETGSTGQNPTLSQTITGLSPGEAYVVSGDYACYAHNDLPASAASFEVAVAGTPIFTGLESPGTLGAGGSWLSFRAEFVAPPGGSVVLQLSGELDPTDNDVAVDNICIARTCHVENGGFSVAVPTGSGGWIPADNALGGWSASGGSIGAYYWLNNSGGPGTVDPAVSQTLSLTVGRRYRLTGDYASISHNATPAGQASLAVDVDQVQVLALSPTPLGVWSSFQLEFNAAAATTVIGFRAEIDGTDNDFGIDNVCVTESCCSVEPGNETLCLEGNINTRVGPRTDTLFLNGQVGAIVDRTVRIAPSTPFTLTIDRTPAGGQRYAMYVWVGPPTPATVNVLPLNVGMICRRTPVTGGPGQPVRLTNNTGIGLLGTTFWPGGVRPPANPMATLLNAPGGIGTTGTFFIQGIQFDPGAPNGRAGVTNGIIVVSQ